MAEPAYTRLPVDERRRRLLELGEELFTRFSYDELSMARIAREAGISKPLLYHYFPSKQAYFRAAFAQAAEQVQALTVADPETPPVEQLTDAVGRYLTWIEAHETPYRKLLQSAGAVPELRELMEELRQATAARILDGLPLATGDGARVRAAVLGWLWFVDGATLAWLDDRAFSREEHQGLLLGTLLGAITAAGGRVALS